MLDLFHFLSCCNSLLHSSAYILILNYFRARQEADLASSNFLHLDAMQEGHILLLMILPNKKLNKKHENAIIHHAVSIHVTDVLHFVHFPKRCLDFLGRLESLELYLRRS